MGITQSELAAKMTAYLGREIRPLTVTRLEGGKRPIGVDELVAAANAMHVKPADLMADSDLPMAAVGALAAGQHLVRATNEVNEAIRGWVYASDRLHRALKWHKQIERLSQASRTWLELIANVQLSDVVREAQSEAEKAQADDSDT